MFINSDLKPLGTVQLQIRSPSTVVSNGLKALLGVQSIQQFGLVSVNIDNIYVCVSCDTSSFPTLLAEYKDVFEGQGQLEDKLYLTAGKSVAPVTLPE